MAWRQSCRCFWAIFVFVVVAGILGVLFIYSGIYNVGASYEDSAVAEWVLETTAKYSVARHAKGIEAPPLDDPMMIAMGLGHYREMCAGCHGAPGKERGPGAMAMNPQPPELAHEVEEWKPNELFWITKNGIRMSGMMAWGKNHSDEDLWTIIAFLQTLPGMTAEEYKAMSEKASPMRDH